MLSTLAQKRFLSLYPTAKDVQTTFCPYRLCPLGAHVDHQHGRVSGFAIDHGVDIIYEPTDNGVTEVSSLNFPGTMQFYVSAVPKKQGDWADHLRGASKALSLKYSLKRGVRAVIEGGLPVGGLSSSAAVIIAFLSALCQANAIVLSDGEMIETALWAEQKYVGVSVGTLDQSCEVYCRKEHLLYLDTQDNSYELIPQSESMPAYDLTVLFSGVERTLVSSAFNMRVDEMKAAAYALKGYAGMPYGKFEDTRLREVPEEVFEQYKHLLPENWRKRATHFYSEQRRIEQGIEAWRQGDLHSFGKRIFESGHSSIYNYVTGSPELIALYEIMQQTEGVYGGRFSGAGFKGCCMAITDPAYRDSVSENITRLYLEKFPELEGKFSVHFCKSADGCGLDQEEIK